MPWFEGSLSDGKKEPNMEARTAHNSKDEKPAALVSDGGPTEAPHNQVERQG